MNFTFLPIPMGVRIFSLRWNLPQTAPFLLVSCWAVMGAAGLWYSGNYQNQAGKTLAPEQFWPGSEQIHRLPGIPTLVVAFHPQCPCSRASAEELRRLLAQAKKPVKVHALIYQPEQASLAWEKTAVMESISHIPGVHVNMDRNGSEIRRFHGRVSGEVWFYGSEGKLLFRGGVTGSRGHAGNNKGSGLLLASINGDQIPQQETPVFGCSLEHSPETDK